MDERYKNMSSEQEPMKTSEEVDAESSEEPTGTDADEIAQEGCEELLARRNEEVKQLQDRVLRLAAETENTRKRIEREKSDGICFANESLLRGLLPVVDNLERAIQHSEQKSDSDSLIEGVRMTLKAFSDLLARFGCVPFDAVGETFDPRYHEAMLQQEAPGPENMVLLEYQKGYKLHERLLRPALVVVSKSPKSDAEE
jgi:molecular chaperone GrpE